MSGRRTGVGAIWNWFGALVALTVLVPAAAAEDDAPRAQGLPLKRIVLYSAGVGFFERAGEVDGDALVDLRFAAKDINDLLKSLVVEDLGGGTISTVNYTSRDPLTKTLKAFAIDLTKNPTLGELLAQVRGQQVEIESAERQVGTILGVETRTRKVGDEVEKVEFLNLLLSDGLRSVPLESIGRIKLVNPQLDAELRQALAVLAGAHDNEKKEVALHFAGQGKRQVRLGYIQETPLWKTSYRLVLEDEGQARLQGWAIVENTTDDDWNDVGLRLVSGRPVSFVMDLYQPLYVPRPEVVPELFASLKPQTYEQDLAKMQLGRDPAAADERTIRRARSEPQPEAAAAPQMAQEAAGQADTFAFDFQRQGGRGGFVPAASAAELGELFQYTIDVPVSLPRQKSAMLPIVDGPVQAAKVSIYNPAVGLKHPLAGLKLSNDTKAHLMQGPITVFDAGAYAGDAQITDLPAGGERLVSYAIDLETEIAVAPHSVRPQELLSLKLVKGTAITRHKQRRGATYRIKNSDDAAKQVLVERPVEVGWQLVEPRKPAEQTASLYRFAVDVAAGKTAELAVEEERQLEEQVALTNLNDEQIRLYLAAPVVSAAVKDALAEVARRQLELRDVAAQMQQLHQQLAAIDEEQSRIRQNMDRLNRNEQLYQRYVKKFSEQEDQVEKLRGTIDELAQREAGLRKSLDEYLANLNLES